MLKLKSLLTEAPADDAAKVADGPLAKSVSILKKLTSDKDFVGVLQKGAQDGDIKDEQIKFSTANVSSYSAILFLFIPAV